MNLLSVDALWLLGEDAAADNLREWLKDIPLDILKTKNPIVKAIMMAFKAKDMLM